MSTVTIKMTLMRLSNLVPEELGSWHGQDEREEEKDPAGDGGPLSRDKLHHSVEEEIEEEVAHEDEEQEAGELLDAASVQDDKHGVDGEKEADEDKPETHKSLLLQESCVLRKPSQIKGIHLGYAETCSISRNLIHVIFLLSRSLDDSWSS